jgi:cytochrome c
MRTTLASAMTLAAALVTGSVHAQGNEARGERLFNQQCRSCHTLEKDGASTLGPNLNGLFGRKAGTGSSYQSSEDMAKSGIVWDDQMLAEYLKNPKAKVPGTKMVYAGMRQDAQLQDLIAYLKKATQ